MSGILGIMKEKRRIADKIKSDVQIKREEDAERRNVVTILDADVAQARREEVEKRRYKQD